MPSRNRTALLIHCSAEQAREIRAAAKREYRTISAYVLRAVEKQLEIERTERDAAASKERPGQRLPRG